MNVVEYMKQDPAKVKWLQEQFNNLQKKMTVLKERTGDQIPYLSHDGKYDKDMSVADLGWWTNGFYSGMLWQMYHATGDEGYCYYAKKIEEKLDRILLGYEEVDHDAGFMWLHTAVADYRHTKDQTSKTRGLHAATLFAGRYNPVGEFLRAWNGGNRAGWIIIDCMMNLPLLYFASDETEDPRYTMIAKKHADTAMKYLVREDGSCNHIGIFDPFTGELKELPGGQGYGPGSSWSRGQAWGLYGFTLSYRHTNEERYLQTAKRIANYFIANVAKEGYLTLCDFRAPKEPVYYDSTAAMIAACGLLELSENVTGLEQGLYLDAAYNLLYAQVNQYADWNPENDGILGMGNAAYHSIGQDHHTNLVYGDYFMIEAILRFLGKEFCIW